MSKIIFLGASNPETLRVVKAIQRVEPDYVCGGFLDSDPEKHGKDFFGFPILGDLSKVPELAAQGAKFVNIITGSTKVRHETSQEIVRLGGTLGNLIHPGVDLTMVTHGRGVYLQEQVVVQAGVRLADNVSIHIGAMVGHETAIGESSFVAHAVSISGCCEIGEGTFIGTNATVLPRVKIGKWVTIGAGAVVTKDVPDFAVVVGNPGKVIKFNQP
jgi:sugar O-acyltransferase (sialic acid O-acetyltransferase NeuD family)